MQVGEVSGVLKLADSFSGPLLQAAAKLVDFSAGVDRANKKLAAFGDDGAKSARKVVPEVDKLQAAYNKLSAQLDPVVARTQKYDRAVETLNAALKRGIITQEQYNLRLAQAQPRLQAAEHWTGRLGRSVGSELTSQFTRFFAVAAGFTAITTTIVSVTKQFIAANLEAEAVQRKVEAATKRAGNASGITAQQINDLSNALSEQLGVDDELIASTLALGTRYNRLSSDVMPEVIKVALDMAAATGQDLSSAFEKAAKMANNPLRALTLLNREGYAVSASQTDLVKKFLRTGEVANAQGVILDILKGQYGGTADEIRDSMGGALTALGTAWENLLEKIGEDHTGPIREGIEALIVLLRDLTARVDDANRGWNLFISRLIEVDIVIQKGRRILGANNTKIIKDLQDELADRQIAAMKGTAAEPYLRMLGLMGGEQKKASASALELTDSERKLNRELGKQTETSKALLSVRQKHAETLEVLSQKMALAARGPGLTSVDRAREEQRINDEHEYRVDLLEKQSKFGAVIGKELADTNRKLKELDRDVQLKLNIVMELPKIDLGGNIKSLLDESMKGLMASLDVMERIEERAREFRAEMSGRAAEFVDYQAFSAAAKKYGDDLARILDQYGLLSAASDEWSIAQEAAARKRDGDARDIQEITAEITAQRAEVQSLAQEWAKFDIAQWVAEPFRRAWESVQSSFVSTMNEMILTGEASWDGFWDNFKRMALEAIEEWLKRWILAHRAAQAEAARTAAINSLAGGKAGGVTGITGSTSGAIGMTGGGSAAGAGQVAGQAAGAGWSQWGTYASYAFLAWVGFKIFEGWTKKRVTFGEATIGGGTSGSGKISRQMEEIIAAITKEVTAVLDQWNIGIEKLGAVTIGRTSKGEFFVKTMLDSFGKFFATMEEAIEYAKTQAIKFAQFSSSTSALVQAAIRGSRAETISGLGSDIDFARMLETWNLPAIAQQIEALTQSLVTNLHRVMDLFRNDFGQMVTAAGSVITNFMANLHGAYNSLMGIEEDPKVVWERNKAAYNAQRAIMIAQITLLIEEIKARIALYAAQRLTIQGFQPGREGGAGGGVGGDPFGPGRGQGSKGGMRPGAPPPTRPDSRNPTNDPQLAALLSLLDNLIRALSGLPPAIEGDRPPGARGGRGGGARGGVRDFIADRRQELDMRGLSEYGRAQAEINRMYDEQAKQIGKNKELLAQLNALRAEELKLLAEEKLKSTMESFREFLGLVTPFDSVRKTAEDLIKSIEESPLGNARKAAMVGRVLDELEKKIERMSQEMTLSLFGELLQDLEKFGADEKLMNEVRRNMAIIEHTLKMEHYRIEIAILKEKGKIDKKSLEALEAAFGFLDKVDPTKFLSPGGGREPMPHWRQQQGGYFVGNRGEENVIDATDRFGDAVKRATELLKKYQDDGLDPLTRDLQEIHRDFEEIVSALGNTPDVITARTKAIQRAMDDFLQPIRDAQRDLFFGENTIADTATQWAQIQSDFLKAQSRFRAGDLSVVESVPDLVQDFIRLAREMTPVGSEGFKDLFIDANRFLNEVLALTPDKLGTATNPMKIENMSSLVEISESQLDRLTMIQESSQTTSQLVDVLVSRLPSGGLASVA